MSNDELASMKTMNGMDIVSDLIDAGISQWEEMSEDVWPDSFYAMKTERNFANSIIVRLTDDAEVTTQLIVRLLVQEAYDTFESFIEDWDDEMLANVPAIVSGLAKAKAWLEDSEK